MVNYRKSVDIIADILIVASEGACKTKVMYQANLSYKLLRKYLALLRKAGLLSCEKRLYNVTPKGQEYLRIYKEFAAQNKRIEKRLAHLQDRQKSLEQLVKEFASKTAGKTSLSQRL